MENIILEDEVTLEGFITYYKYENPENGYRIALFKIDDNKQNRCHKTTKETNRSCHLDGLIRIYEFVMVLYHIARLLSILY